MRNKLQWTHRFARQKNLIASQPLQLSGTRLLWTHPTLASEGFACALGFPQIPRAHTAVDLGVHVPLFLHECAASAAWTRRSGCHVS